MCPKGRFSKIRSHIGHEMQARIYKEIIESGSKLSVLIDEATSIRFGRENRTLDDEHDYHDIIWKKLEA